MYPVVRKKFHVFNVKKLIFLQNQNMFARIQTNITYRLLILGWIMSNGFL
ncbi:MAG: hypothetical protein ETSY2_40015 [Candidatus Entotheonella gemina]|uniref:Uncharacterized protein n=1 Tax=Candidatus Entotheonella gemina TaxID=1429439 RepID=W4LPN5_9BACT|nr:MAG: hypothetical protein ETSY2_40015 [Candidatus Entotheonella gemina]